LKRFFENDIWVSLFHHMTFRFQFYFWSILQQLKLIFQFCHHYFQTTITNILMFCFTVPESAIMGKGDRTNAVLTDRGEDITCSCSGVGARIEISMS
jgi:hypothetical protein